jgi:hypothetical protein
MINIRKNPNFTKWYQVFSFGDLVDEFKQKAEAVSLARNIARNTKTEHIVIEGRIKKIS